MKINEVFGKLIENPKVVCRVMETDGWRKELSIDGMGYFIFKRFDASGAEIPGDKLSAVFNGNVSIRDEWELVPQEVAWQEGLQAWLDGKEIKVEVPTEYGTECCVLAECGMFAFNKAAFMTGKWFVR